MLKNLFALITLIFLLISCSGTKEIKKEEEKKHEIKKDADSPKEVIEDFDMTPYRTSLDIEEIEKNNEVKELDIWYDYENITQEDINNEIANTASGYRVQVLITDNLEEANNLRSEIYFKTNQKSVYVIFDPPFYKVKVGDFINLSDANDLSYKLNQMGYSEARVVSETINIFH
jgi:hypothetical protein